jgi:hypothetical protein
VVRGDLRRPRGRLVDHGHRESGVPEAEVREIVKQASS